MKPFGHERLSKAQLAIRRAVRESCADIAASELVLVACSGGGDSLALAAASKWVADRDGWRVGAAVVDHGMRKESAAEARAVFELLTEWGFDPVHLRHVDLGAASEAAARTARYAAIDDVVEESGATAVLLGHTLDDQAETVLLGLARGSGARSLAGMAEARGPLRRPLLRMRRDDVRSTLEPDWPVVEDPHNADARFARVRVRHDVLPVLEDAVGPGVAEALARTATQLRDDADALDETAAQALLHLVAETGELPADALAIHPAAIRRRVLRACAIAAGATVEDLGYDHLVELDRLVVAWHGQGPIDLPGGVRASRDCGRLRMSAGAS